MVSVKAPTRSGFKLALISKGLRHRHPWLCDNGPGFNLALISKGLRLKVRGEHLYSHGFKLDLISKGLRHSPVAQLLVTRRFKLALISKGLKNARKQNRPFRACFAVRVVWSIKNQNRFVARWLQQVVRQHGYAG